MTALTNLRLLLHLAWQALGLYGRHFLPLLLIGGLPTLLYHLFLLALGHSQPPGPGLETSEILTPALRIFSLWNLPNLLLLSPLVNGALVAAVRQLRHQESLQPLLALQDALRAGQRLLGATWFFWLPTGAAGGFAYWVWTHTQVSPGQMLGGMMMIALVAGFLYYWWVRWAFLTQVVIEEGCGPAAAFTRSSRLVAGHWWLAFGLSTLLSTLPSLLDNLLDLAGPWAVMVGQSLVMPLSTVGMTLLYRELRGSGEEGDWPDRALDGGQGSRYLGRGQ